MQNAEIILSGPEYTGPEYLGSIAQFLIPKMKSRPKDSAFQVDCATGKVVTFHEFLKESLEVAEGLTKFGLKTGDVVVFSCSTNIRSNVTAMGIIFSEGIFAPLNYNLKPLELQHFLKQFQPRFIICEAAKGKEFQSATKAINLVSKIILIDSNDETGEGFYSWHDIKANVDVDNYVPYTVEDPKKNIALIMCSSGSTGLPKGVALSHYSCLLNLSITEFIHVPQANENFLFTSPLYWISGILLLINAIYFGQTIYIPKTFQPEDILEGIQKCRPSFFMTAPTNLMLLAEHENFKNYDVSSVKVVFCAGGNLGPSILGRIKGIWADLTIVALYGLSEVNGGITMYSGSENANAVGKIMPEAKIKVVDPDTGKSLGPYKTGECRIKTKKIMSGYYKNEEATKAAFDENGWFRTGDLLYYDEDGVLYFVDRMKEVIQYLNLQISPIELESFILSLPGVKDVAVVPIPHETDTNHIKALVVKDPKYDISEEFIVQQVKENFMAFKQLTEGVQFVDSLPRTEVGKLRREEARKKIHNTI